MIRIVIFGTGSGGQRAWHAAGDFEGIDVVAFADNDPAKHGTRIHGRPVWSAEQLAAGSSSWDYVLLASQWHAEIAEGLACLHVSRRRMLRFEPVSGPGLLRRLAERRRPNEKVQAGTELWARSRLPKVLILTFETLNDNHGTGVLLKRYFGDFPPSHLFSLHHKDSGLPWLAQSAQIEETGVRAVRAVTAALARARFVPDVIYATALHEADLELLRAVLAAVKEGTPVVQHFMDFIPNDEDAFAAKFRRLSPRITEVWALTDSLQRMLGARFARPVELVTGLLQRITAGYRQEHRGFDRSFRTILVGNFYNPGVVPVVRELWARCRERLPGLGPIEWYVAPNRLQDLLDGGTDPGLDLVWRGFFTGTRLAKILREADLGILPFNHGTEATSNYQRYSLPSRLAEFASAGVPVFALATHDTPLAAFVQAHGLGQVADASEIETVTEQLTRFIKDREARAACGAAARRLAEEQFEIGRFRSWINGRMLALMHGPKCSKRCSARKTRP
jgi:hypothetical protein